MGNQHPLNYVGPTSLPAPVGTSATRGVVHSLLLPFGRRFALTILYFSCVIMLGMVGYRYIEGWSWIDGLYMAVITATSVGFMEVYPLSTEGRFFTMVLLGLGIVGLGFWWALTTALIVEADLGGLLRRRRLMIKIGSLSDHFIVCGAGRMGSVIIEEMLRSHTPFVAIEKDPVRIAHLMEEHPQLLIIEGDATKEQTLQLAGIDVARGLACSLRDDGENLLLCMTARGLRPHLEIVTRATDQESLAKLRRAGANHAISPNYTGAVRMAATLLRPTVVSFLDAAVAAPELSLRLEEARLTAESDLVGKTLADAKIPQRTGLVVIAVRSHRDGRPQYNPGPETRLEQGDDMIVLGAPEQIEGLRAYVRGELD